MFAEGRVDTISEEPVPLPRSRRQVFTAVMEALATLDDTRLRHEAMDMVASFLLAEEGYTEVAKIYNATHKYFI